jgi:chloride channel 3/4/5
MTSDEAVVTNTSTPPSPTSTRRTSNPRRYGAFLLPSNSDLVSMREAEERRQNDEHTPLLAGGKTYPHRRTHEGTSTPKPRMSRRQSATGQLIPYRKRSCRTNSFPGSLRHHDRTQSWGARLAHALNVDGRSGGSKDHSQYDLRSSVGGDDRVWYDQFTSTDWVHDNIADAYRVKELRSRKDLRGRLHAFFDGSQGWILSALVGCATATIAYMVDVSEAPIFDWKEGYCSSAWFWSEKVGGPRPSRSIN